MKNTLVNQLIIVGATRRLEELNKEREQLVKLIERYSVYKTLRFSKKKKSYKGKHWTQTAAGKRKMSKQIKAMWRLKKMKESDAQSK